MRKLVLIAIFVSGLLATQMFSANMLNELKTKHSKSEFGQYFFEMMELKARQGTNVKYIVDLVKGILDKLINEQTSDDQEHSTRMAQYDSTIKGLENSVEELSSEQQSTNRVVGDLSQDIAAVAQTINSQTVQLSVLDAQLQGLRQQRSQGQGEYDEQQKGFNRILGAIDQILRYLSQAVLDQSGQVLLETRKSYFLNKIKEELGAKHPISLMVQMTTKFDEATARRVIRMLEELRDSYEGMLKRAEERENTTQSVFQTMSGQLEDVRNRLSADLAQNVKAQFNLQQDLVVQQRRAKEITDELTANNALLVLNRNQRESFNSNYNSRSKGRGEEIQIVQSVYDLLSQNLQKPAA